MTKVIGLRGQAVIDPRTPRDDVITLAERILEMARSGEIQGLAYVCHYSDGATGSSNAGVVGYSMIGRLQSLNNALLKDMDNPG